MNSLLPFTLAPSRQNDPTSPTELIRLLSLALDQSPASAIITDTHGTIEYVNLRFTEVTGYAPAEAVGQTPRMLKSGITPLAVYADLWKTIRSGATWRGEIQNRRKNGDLYWDSASISPVRDSSGAVSHFVAIQQDVTAQKETERNLQERESRFRQLAENIREVFFIMSVDYSELLYVSPAYEEIWGRSMESAYENPRSFLDGVAPDDREKVLANIASLQAGETPAEIEFRVIRPDGQVRWVMKNAVPVRDEHGAVYRICGAALDITKRHHAEEELRESQERFRLLTEATFDGIAISVDGSLCEVNSGYAKMLGYTVEELIGKPITELVAEESRDDVQARLSEDTEGRYELVHKRKDGRSIYAEATARRLIVGGRVGRITALHDVTERRELEQQFRQAQKMEAVGRLAGGVAHDFNNLLTVIMGYSDMLIDDLAPHDPRREGAECIRKAAVDAAGLTRQLLAFSRQQVMQPRLVGLQPLVADAEKMLKRLIGEDVDLATVLDGELLSVRVDPGQLEQVIMNLAINARDAMPDGGKLTIEAARVRFDESSTQTHWPAPAGDYAMLAVSDTGIGMDETTKGRIFEPFFTTKELGKGTGLGLATVYGIVKQSGGFVWVYSELGCGSTFKVYLPLADSEGVAATDTCARPAATGGDEVIVLAEDAPVVRTATRQMLERFGYRVLEAATPRAALQLAAGDSPEQIHLLITDVVMPQMNGRTLAEHFKILRPDVKVLFISGYTDDAIIRHGVLEPGIAFLQKPFAPDALARKVREVLGAPSKSSSRMR